MVAARLINALYSESMVLADEVRAYFDDSGRAERDALGPLERVVFSCESLKVTTRLMHVIAWLLMRKAMIAGELIEPGRASSRRLGPPIPSDPSTVAGLPEEARRLIAASIELHRRLAMLDDAQDEVSTLASPARALQQRLQQLF